MLPISLNIVLITVCIYIFLFLMQTIACFLKRILCIGKVVFHLYTHLLKTDVNSGRDTAKQIFDQHSFFIQCNHHTNISKNIYI